MSVGGNSSKPHPKKESVWHKQYVGQPLADLRDYPSEEAMLNSWRQGIEGAKKLAKRVGM